MVGDGPHTSHWSVNLSRGTPGLLKVPYLLELCPQPGGLLEDTVDLFERLRFTGLDRVCAATVNTGSEQKLHRMVSSQTFGPDGS